MGKLKLTEEDLAKAKHRPLPKTLRSWFGEVDGLKAFVSNLRKLKLEHGQGWVDSMTRYNAARLSVLGDNPPPSLPLKVSRPIVVEVLKLLK